MSLLQQVKIEAAERIASYWVLEAYPAEMAGVALLLEGLYPAEINLGQPLELPVETPRQKQFVP